MLDLYTYTRMDARRETCPVSVDERLGWVLTRHADIRRALLDHHTFSNAVSHHLSVPNGVDPPEHTSYRRLIEPYFDEARMREFEPLCRRIVRELAAETVARGSKTEVMEALARPFAARAQCAFLGWSADMERALLDWATNHTRAIRDLDREALAHNAHVFEDLIAQQLRARRDADAEPEEDLTARLMHEQVHGRRLNDEEIVSILRNWTAGEVGTLSASVGILLHFLAAHPEITATLRAEPARIPYAVDEILRIQGPLLTNRRVTTCPVRVGDQDMEANERVTIYWPSANRDPRVFDDPLTFRWDRDSKENLLYGVGVHVCPGAPLARLELRIIVEEWLARVARFAPSAARAPEPAEYPAGGFAAVWLDLS